MKQSDYKRLRRLLSNPGQIVLGIVNRLAPVIKDDERFLRLKFRAAMGHRLNLDNPRSFFEKIQWLKLYDRRPEYTSMVDKCAVKKFVAGIIGEKYVIPTLGVWNTPDEIDWDTLPEQFVLKTTHVGGGTGVLICRDKNSFDRERAKRILTASLADSNYRLFREWPYKNVPRRIIAEKYMESHAADAGTGLNDYKFYCFNAQPRYCQVIRDRRTKETIDFYDTSWNHQEFVGLNPDVKNGATAVERPRKLEEALDICRRLSSGIPFVRVDLYFIDDEIYFGEMTFYPASGLGSFTPAKWADTLGDMISLPEKRF